jgi:hypothetical protein
MPAMNMEIVTMEKLKALLAKHSLCRMDSISKETRLGEDLGIIGDDADEFLEDFSSEFKVDISNMIFHDYFPDEATAEMHYYTSSIMTPPKNPLLKLLKVAEGGFWKLIAKKTSFKTITVADLLLAVKNGRWR